MVTIKYSDETDRAYGLSGMVVCMGLMENEEYIESVTLDDSLTDDSQANADSPAGYDDTRSAWGLHFTPDFFYTHNQKLSAKAVWRDSLSNFNLLTNLVVANIMARAIIREHSDLSRELSDLLLKHISAEGREACQLEDDEIRDIFNNTTAYFRRAFCNSTIASTVTALVDALQRSRTLDSEQTTRILHLMRRF